MTEMHFAPYTLDPKAYNLLKKMIFMKGGASLVFLLLNFAKICQSFLLFYCKPTKKNDEKNVKDTQRYLKSVFDRSTKQV